MPSQPHVLLVAWGYAPIRAGGVFRAMAIANEFAATGWRVTVAHADADAYEKYVGTDTSLLAAIDPRVETVSVPFSSPTRDTDVRTFGRARVLLGAERWGKWLARRNLRIFPETIYGHWRPTIEDAVRHIHAADPVDLTIATANPYVAFQAGFHLHERFGVPFVMDYRDAWTLDVFSGEKIANPRSRVDRLEQKYMAAATEIWFVNEPIRAWHQRRYPEAAAKMVVVENGWDPRFLGERSPAKAPVGDAITFGYLGTISPKVPLEDLLAGWTLARDRGTISPSSRLVIAGHLGYFATPDAKLGRLLDAAQEAGVSFIGDVPKANVADFYRDIDVLVLALGAGKYVTSGKVYEYMATGKPIVAVHPPTNHAAAVLAGYCLSESVTDVTPEGVALALDRIVKRARTATEDEYLEAFAVGTAARRDLRLVSRSESLLQTVAAS